jgi:hypothetical protein
MVESYDGIWEILPPAAEMPTGWIMYVSDHLRLCHQRAPSMHGVCESQIETSVLMDQCCLASEVHHQMTPVVCADNLGVPSAGGCGGVPGDIALISDQKVEQKTRIALMSQSHLQFDAMF